MKLNIREAVASDYESLCVLFDEGDALHRENLPWIFQRPRGLFVKGTMFLAWSRMRRPVSSSPKSGIGLICVMIRESSEIPIFVRRRYAVVDNVVVKREFQRTGIGRALMEKAHEWAVAEGAESIELNVWEFNQEAIEF